MTHKPLVVCTRCWRHVRVVDLVCPFCGRERLVGGGLRSALAGSAMALAVAGCTPQSKSAPPDASLSPSQEESPPKDGAVKAAEEGRDGGELRVDPMPVPPYAPVPFVEKP
jgi:hypothetical protein